MPVMLCSDWHVEERVDPKTVNGLNEYNLDIASACIERMAEAFEWLQHDSRYDCRQGIVWLGGDLFSGYIHEELVEGNFLSPVQAVVWLQERVERMLRTIAATCPNLERIIVPCNDGNHGRMTNKIRVATRTANSLEWLLYETLAARLADEPRFESFLCGRWRVQLPRRLRSDSLLLSRGLGSVHGRRQQTLIPMRRGINELRKYRKIDVVNFGHFHQRLDLPDLVGNGSMIGITPYSMRLKCSPEPEAAVLVLDGRDAREVSQRADLVVRASCASRTSTHT